MRRFVLILTIAFVLLLRAPAHAQDALFRVFGNYVEALRAQTGIPGLVAAVVGTRDIVWQRPYGQLDIERLKATRTDTPFHVDGLTQLFTASMILRCVEEGHLSLDDRIGQFAGDSPDANATVAQILTHTSGTAENPVFAYDPPRLDPLALALSACSEKSSREMLSDLLERLAMFDSVPGVDSIDLVPPYEGVTHKAIERYSAVLDRLATPYSVDTRLRATPSHYEATTIRPASGLVSTVWDLAQFDLAIKNGYLLKPETLAAAWRPPVSRGGEVLPHGIGWFVQNYNGKQIVWQFGMGENASSSLMVMVPSKGLTLILLANSDGLVKPFVLPAGDVTVSPFARVFLSIFAR